MKFKKILSVFLIVLLSVSLLAGCKSEKPSQDDEPDVIVENTEDSTIDDNNEEKNKERDGEDLRQKNERPYQSKSLSVRRLEDKPAVGMSAIKDEGIAINGEIVVDYNKEGAISKIIFRFHQEQD